MLTIKCKYHDFSLSNATKFHSKFIMMPSVRESVLHLNNNEKLEILLKNSMINFDVITLTETWNSETTNHTFEPGNLDGYSKYIGQTGKTLKSGCGVYISNKLSCIPRSDLNISFHNNTNEFESVWVEMVNVSPKNILIGTIYRHPSKYDQPFLDYLNNVLTQIKKENKICIITGDFNYDLLKYGSDSYTETFLDTFLNTFYQPLIFYPTRVVDNARPTLIDKYIYQYNR